jgi:hypothetical protein
MDAAESKALECSTGIGMHDDRTKMMKAKTRRGWAGLVAMLLVAAQAVYATEACVHAQASAAHAVARADMPDCEQMKSAASCLAQCNADSQSSGHPPAAVPDAPLEAVLTLPALPALAAALPARRAPLPDCGPSPPIRFCTFLL